MHLVTASLTILVSYITKDVIISVPKWINGWVYCSIYTAALSIRLIELQLKTCSVDLASSDQYYIWVVFNGFVLCNLFALSIGDRRIWMLILRVYPLCKDAKETCFGSGCVFSCKGRRPIRCTKSQPMPELSQSKSHMRNICNNYIMYFYILFCTWKWH